jgi:predicted aconitase
MYLSPDEKNLLAGLNGKSAQKAMEILVALGTIYEAEDMVPVESVQVAGVSYDNLGEAGLGWLAEMAAGGGKAQVLTTLNPAGMDIENWQALGIDPAFASSQIRVMDAFARMGILTTCTCTPYLVGNLPHFGEHIAWAESSAVCYANSVIGARTNREGGPSALAASLTGRTPAYGLHLDQNRSPEMTFVVQTGLYGSREFGALGKVIGDILSTQGGKRIPYIRGIESASLESLKSFCASIATYGGVALFHMEGITPESSRFSPPEKTYEITREDLDLAILSLTNSTSEQVDFISLGCPHLSIREIAHLAVLLSGKKVTKEFWITTARPTRALADQAGYTQIIEASGARFAVDTCCVVAPIKDRFHSMATDSAKACYYAQGKNQFMTFFTTFEEAVAEALK